MKKTYKIDVDCANCANKMEQAAQKTEGAQEEKAPAKKPAAKKPAKKDAE